MSPFTIWTAGSGVLHSRAGRSVALAGLLLAAACDTGTRSAETPAEPTPEFTAQEILAAELRQRVDQILLRSDEATVETTVETAAGLLPARVPERPEFDREPERWRPPASMQTPTPGTERVSWEPGHNPVTFLLADDRSVIAAEPDAVRVYPPEGEPRILLRESANNLQWNAGGTRLLASGPGFGALLSWPEGETLSTFGGLAEKGRLNFAPSSAETDAPGPFWMLSDELIFDASQRYRVFWTVREFDSPDATELRTVADMKAFAFMGTLPPLRRAWAIPADEYRISPEQGSLWWLTEDGGLDAPATDAGENVDLFPAADSTGRISFLRTPRLVDGALTRSTWAWSAAPDEPARPITAEPTYGLALSPSGQALALLVMREGNPTLLTAPASLLLERNLTPQLEARRAFEENVRGALEDLRATLKAMEPDGPPPLTERLDEQQNWPPESLVESMGAAFAGILEERFGLTAGDSVESLGALDDFFEAADGLWPEEPATVVALAGLYVQALDVDADLRWLLATSTPALGTDAGAIAAGHELYTLHSVFYTARERLAGRLSLYGTAVELATEWTEPIILTENYRSDTVNLLMISELTRLGFDFEAGPGEEFRRLVREHPENALVNSLARERAHMERVPSVEAMAALNVATQYPASGTALLNAADSLRPYAVMPDRLRLYRQAELLSPEDPEVWLRSGETHMNAWKPDMAEERLRRAKTLGDGGFATEQAEAALGLLQTLREEAAEE